MGGAVSAGVDNDDLVDNLKAASYIKTPIVERVLRAIDRGDYFTAEHRDQAYRDNAWKKGNLHLSAPCIYAKVMESLDLSSGLSFLNLGSGTGYLSTMAGLIIGPEGINHGIELHADVITYALDRIEDFKKTSALDAFSFCEPQFVQGNCLCLPPDVRLYDRVYCGASCPDTHENYMKGLIKEGGVLVMPINDQLVKVTRTGPSNWETSSLLPVSFSSLVMPDASYPPESVSLPDVDLLDLQNMCRQEIRTILRGIIDIEHPGLATAANKPIVQKPKKRCPREQFPGVIVPYMHGPFYDSDDDDPGMMSDDNMDDSDNNPTLFDSSSMFISQSRSNQLTTVIEFARSLTGQRLLESELHSIRRNNQEEEEDNDGVSKKIGDKNEETVEVKKVSNDNVDSSFDSDEKCDKNGASSQPPAHKSFLKKFKIRKESETETETEDKLSDSNEEAVSSVPAMPQSEPIPMTSTPVLPAKSNKKREKFDSGVGDEIEDGKGPSSDDSDQGDEEDIEMDMDSTDSDFSDSMPTRPILRSRTRMKVTRLLDPDCPCGGDCSESWCDKDEDEGKDNDAEEEKSQTNNPTPTETYSTYMREKITQLPLPQALKMYLNYYREL